MNPTLPIPPQRGRGAAAVRGELLSGLRAALAAQGKAAEAAEVSARFHEAWAQADFALAGSRL